MKIKIESCESRRRFVAGLRLTDQELISDMTWYRDIIGDEFFGQVTMERLKLDARVGAANVGYHATNTPGHTRVIQRAEGPARSAA